MKFKVLNVTQATGISKKTGSPFAMKRIAIAADLHPVNTQNYQLEGAGFAIEEIDVLDSFYPELSRHFAAKFQGAPLELDFRVSASRGRMLIEGFESTGPVAMPKAMAG